MPPLPTLPTEIIHEIFKRLPVKSLLRFRCVSRSCLSLISSPQFIKAHLQLSSRNDENGHNHLLLASYENQVAHTFSLHSVAPYNNEPLPLVVHASHLGYPFHFPHHLVVLGYCDGLFLIFGADNRLILWNPSTKKSNKLPPSGITPLPLPYMKHGLGYDPSTGDYKVVEMAQVSVKSPNGYLSTLQTVSVYNVRTNTWRKNIPIGLKYSLDGFEGAFVAGALHWCDENGRRIVSFDLASEVFGEIAPPGSVNGKIWSPLTLGGWLCVFHDVFQTRIDIWAMKVYGVEESWTKLVCFVREILPNPYVLPLFWFQGDAIVVEYGKDLMMCNLRSNKLKFLEISYTGDRKKVSAFAYTETLISPNNGCGLELN